MTKEPQGRFSFIGRAINLVSGINFTSLLPVLPYVAAFGAAWIIQAHRYDAKAIDAELKAKDVLIEQADIRANAAGELAASKDAIISEYKTIKDASEARIDSLESNLTELSLRQPKDTTRIIDNTRNTADEIIKNDDSYDWLRSPYPDIMLNNANKRIAASKNYGLPLAPLAGGYPVITEP